MADSIDEIFIRKITGIIIANLGKENFGANELAREAGISLYRLNRRLNLLNGKKVNQFIREIRLQKALELLNEGIFTVSEIAYRTGFSSPSYFITCFHEHFGYAPGNLRKGSMQVQQEKAVADGGVTRDKRRKRSPLLIFGAFLTLVAIVSLIIFITSTGWSAKEPVPPQRITIAVLPFWNMSNDSTDQYFYDGVMDELFNDLCKIHAFSVISRSSVERYRNAVKTVPEIAGELGNVDYIIEGSGQKYGNAYRLRIQLIEAETDRHVWSQSFGHSAKNAGKYFRIQNRFAREITASLKATMTNKEKLLIEKVPTDYYAALILYQRAKEQHSDYLKTLNNTSYETSEDFYRSALKIDSTFARAYTGLAALYWARYYSTEYFRESFMDTCLFLAKKALSFDDQTEEAWYIRGQYYRERGYAEEALANYDKAIEINPSYLDAYYRKAYLLAWVQGDYVKSLESCLRALDLVRGNKDMPVMLKTIARAYLDVGLIDKAKYNFLQAFNIDRNKASYLNNLGFIELCQGNFEEALKFWKEEEKINPASVSSLNYYFMVPGHDDEGFKEALKDVENFKRNGSLNLQRSHRVGFAYYQAGKKREAEEFFNQQIRYCNESIRLNRNVEQRKVVFYDMAATYAFLGEKEKAYEYLDKYSKKKTFDLPLVTFMRYDRMFNSIRNEDRFREVLEGVESKYQAEHERVKKWLEEQNLQ